MRAERSVVSEGDMRVAYVVTRAHHGGAQGHVAALIDHFRGLYDVVLATGEEGYLTEFARDHDVPVTIIPSLHPDLSPFGFADDVRAFRELRSWLRDVRPTVLHTHSTKAGGIGRLAAFSVGVPTVFTAHGWGFTDGVPRQRKLLALPFECVAARVTGAIITVSQADLDLANKYRIRARQKTVRIVNGLPRHGAAASPGCSGTVEIVCVARFSRQKDQDLLIRALRGVEGPWRLRLVGDGPLASSVRDLVSESGLDDRVEFLGDREDVEAILAHSDLFVLPSNWEGLPLAILEAMRAGLPVVASDVGGVSEAVADGETGLLVPRGNAEDLRTALDTLVADPDRRALFGANGRARFLRSFVDTGMFEGVDQVYIDLRDRRTSRRESVISR
ncbi:MAG: glycosyltransferase family 4 protein [Acidimicrobiales bacterium]